MKSMVSLQGELGGRIRIWLSFLFGSSLVLEGFEYVLRQSDQGRSPYRV
jgi:hypothetical protein